MANVYDITARIMKRVQVKDYQPMEAEVTMKAELEEGDDHNSVVMSLMHEAHIAVLAGLKGTPPAKAAPTVNTSDDEDEDEDEAPKKKPAKKAAKKAPAKKAAKPEPEDSDEDDEDEDEDEAPKKPAKKAPAKKAAKPEPEDSDEDDEDEDDGGDDSDDEDEGVMDENELQKYASGLIQSGKLNVGAVKAAIADLGVTHIRNLDAKGRKTLKSNLDEMVTEAEEL